MCDICEVRDRSVAVINTEDGGIQHMCEPCSVEADEASDTLELVDLGALAIAQEFDLCALEVMEVKLAQRITYAEVAANFARR